MKKYQNSLSLLAMSPLFAIKNVVLGLIVCSGLLACASAPPAPVPPALQAAQHLEQRAAQAFAQGDWPNAQADYQTAAEVYASLALVEPQMRTLLSLARVQSEAGQTVPALQTVSRVLAQPDFKGLSSGTQLLAHGRAGALGLPSDASAAQMHVQQALALCASTCTQQAALQVLQARIALQQGQAAQALVLANNALKTIAYVARPESSTAELKAQFKVESKAVEQANALRVRAYAALALQQAQTAAEDAQAALALDQNQGLSARVVDDLRILVDAYRALWDGGQVQRYQALLEVAVAARATLSSPDAPALSQEARE